MSRKDYIAVARLIADEVERASPLFEASRITGASNIARGLADLFKADNPNFDRQRFYFACALDDNGRPDWNALTDAIRTPWTDDTTADKWKVTIRTPDGDVGSKTFVFSHRVHRNYAELTAMKEVCAADPYGDNGYTVVNAEPVAE